MPNELPIGTLFVESNILLKPQWMRDAVIGVGIRTLNQFRGFDGFVTASETREGDFSLILGVKRPDPFLALFVGVPGPNKTPIVQTIFLKGQ